MPLSLAQGEDEDAPATPPSPSAEGGPATPEPATLPYSVEVTAGDDSDLADLGRAVAQTVTLRERAPTDALGLLGRVRSDLPRLQEALRAEGYWGGQVSATIDGLPLDDPALPARLAAATGPVPVVITLAPRQRYRIGHVTVVAEPSGAAAEVRNAALAADLPEGQPARAEAVLAAESAMLDALRAGGHPLATTAGRDITVDHDRQAMDITWRIAPGPRARFATPEVRGQSRTDTGLLRRTAARQLEGRDYSPAAVERARRALVSLGVFDSVRVEAGTTVGPDGTLPIAFVVSERPLRALGGSIAYETNFGLAVSVFWEHRNLFGGAERLRLEAEASRISDGSFGNATYRTFATLTQPEIFERNIRLISRIGLVKENLEAYDREAFVASSIAEHPLTERLTLQFGPSFETGRIGRYEELDPYTLVGFLGGLRWDSTNSLLNPSRGIRASVSATPYYSIDDSSSYVRLMATGSTYFDLTGDQGSILALRTAVGSALGASFDQITLDKRFYAGGGGSVRGYTYQSIGPRDSGNRPLGGASLLELSAEWRQRISGPWGAVAFVDAGTVSEDETPGTGTLRVGVGAGLRYLTSIGPIRVDVGVPLNPQQGDPAYGLYVGIGQAF
ncbi:autotransporter assembly complex protein TamA [Roseomonas sp. HJA6]|uniref:Autotransporter assembly complex protein TamA n=1 Tax=Roseomonas alba TaxID=2846776 RepID=A0ABS7A651_9PROT|nr:autotransporter assembly complex protein TamA [Neoroseomonas alba]